MKKKIANALELVLLAGSFIVLNMANIQVVNPNVSTSTLGHMKPLTLMAHYTLQYYPMLFLYAVCTIMCVISIAAKSEHRDGKLHATLPVILFLLVNWNLISLQDQVGNWFIVGYNFPATIFEICMIGAVIIGFAKRSTLIAGLPKVVVKQESTKDDELKKYKELLDSGAITQEEYDAKKKQLLG